MEEKDKQPTGETAGDEQEKTKQPDQKTGETPSARTKKKKSSSGSHQKDKEIEELGNKLIELNDKYLRLSAEFDNYRKRTLKEKMELTRAGGESVLSNLLPVVDNLERALDSVRQSSDIKGVKDGIELIHQHFLEFLKKNGIQEIDCLNQEFDSDFHDAITKIPAPEPKLKGKVVDVIQKGYILHDRVIRYARVVVGD